MEGEDEISGAHGDELPTLAATLAPRMKQIVDPPPASAAGSRRSTAAAARTRRSTVTLTAVRALHAEEAARASGFGRAVAILSACGVLAQPLFPFSSVVWINRMMVVTLGALFCVGIWVWRRARDERHYTRATFRVFGSVGVVGVLVIQYAAGVFSPTPVLVTLGVAFFALGNDERFAAALSICAAASYFVVAGLVTFGFLPDVGLFPALSAPLPGRLFMVVMVPAVFLVTLWQARLSRAATLAAIQRSNDAILLVRQREAQLDEANQNLDLALHAAAGKRGRYTDSVVGKYLLAEIVGRGAMGEIYAASHVETGDAAAVKLLQASALQDPHLLQRFLREVKIAARLRSPNVVTVYDVGEADDGAPFIAMELLQGTDLSALLRQQHQLDLPAVLDLVDGVARGLAAAHAASIVHRDLKPQNIFLSERAGAKATWKILDFGVSKLDDTTGTLTRHAVVGTPGYMAPEQARGSDADARSDIFGLGAVTYRALTGQPPFSGSDTPQVLFEIVYRSPMRPSELVRSLHPDVELALVLALAKGAEDRFGGALEFAAALRSAAAGGLDPALRARGASVLAAQPWGRQVVDAHRWLETSDSRELP